LRGCGSSWPKVWTLGLAFGGFTLTYARPKAPLTILYWLCIFSPFLWTLNKDWPLNPMASLYLDGHSVKRPLTYVQKDFIHFSSVFIHANTAHQPSNGSISESVTGNT
jgi:hypothetical protein